MNLLLGYFAFFKGLIMKRGYISGLVVVASIVGVGGSAAWYLSETAGRPNKDTTDTIVQSKEAFNSVTNTLADIETRLVTIESMNVANPDSRTAELSNQVNAMQEQLAMLIAMQELRTGDDAEENENLGESQPNVEGESGAESGVTRVTKLDKLVQTFEYELIDEQWSNVAQQTIDDVFTNPMLEGTQLAAADCRAERCRIEVVHEKTDLASLEEFELNLGMLLKDTMPSMSFKTITDSDGSKRTIAYMARSGVPLYANIEK